MAVGGRLPKWLQKFVRISSRKHDEMSSFCLNKGFRLQKTNTAARRWKQPPKRPFHHVSRDKILHDSWSISAALARVSPTAIFNEEKALGTRLLVRPSYRYKLIQGTSHTCCESTPIAVRDRAFHNLVPRVLRLIGQRVVARRDSGVMQSLKQESCG